jgi:hypothetical protein
VPTVRCTAGVEEAVMKWSLIGVVGAIVFLSLNDMAVAGQAVPSFSVSREAGKARLTVTAGDLRFEETLTPVTFDIKIVGDGDIVRLAGDKSGDVEISRGQRTYKVRMAAVTEAELRTVRAMLAGSEALRQLEVVTADARAQGSKYASLLQSANALLRIVQGDARATGELVVQAMAQQPIGVRAIAQRSRADDCWDGYTRAVLRYTYEYEGCVREAQDRWWEVYRLAWCAYEYDLKATLAGFWLLDCSGFPL